jgi:hypothetical protein
MHGGKKQFVAIRQMLLPRMTRINTDGRIDYAYHNVGASRISNNISGRASQATGIFDLKTGMQPQMHTDSHRYDWSSGRMGRHRKVRTVGHLGSFIRVHMCSSVVKNTGLGLVAASPRQAHPRNPWSPSLRLGCGSAALGNPWAD